MRCSHCDSRVTKKDKFCPECGTEIVLEEKAPSQINGTKSNHILIVIGVLLLIAVGALIAFGDVEGTKSAIIGNKTVAFSDNPEAIAAASQSVVKLNCYDKSGELYATGSGFAYFEENVIVTNYHVVKDNVYSIKAFTEDGVKFDIAYVLAADEERDIAILGTKAPHNLTLLRSGNGNTLQKGEKVVAIGSPLGLLNSVSTGVFSGYTNENGMDVLQFTASISSGSSGGALFNDAGEVLGITFASYEAGQNLNLAIPMTQVERVWNNRPNVIMTIQTFYGTQTPTYSVDYVLKCYDDLSFREVYIEGWVSEYFYIKETPQFSWVLACNDFEDIQYTGAADKNIILYAKTSQAYNAVKMMKTGCYIRAKGRIKTSFKYDGVTIDVTELSVIS